MTSSQARADSPGLPKESYDVWLHDSQSARLVNVGETAQPSIYVCGVTPYDSMHMGHGALYIYFDVLRRVLRDAGLEPRLCTNVTDVDDPLFARADSTGQDWRGLAERETAKTVRLLDELRVEAPDVLMSVSGAMEDIIAAVETLTREGYTYAVDGDLYFDLLKAGLPDGPQDEYLTLFGKRGGDPDRAGKRHPLDPLLWHGQEPADRSWASPMGDGRPGWHIECAAITDKYLGLPVTIQAGGDDLEFPHHFMTAAMGRVLAGAIAGAEFSTIDVRIGAVCYDGSRMSKSLGNMVFVEDLLEEWTAPEIRLAVLRHHYLTPWTWSTEDLVAGRNRLNGWRRAAGRSDQEDIADLHRVRTCLADDLGSHAALQRMDTWARRLEGLRAEPSQPGQTVFESTAEQLFGVAVRV